MCGFAGLLRWGGLDAEDPARVRAGAERLAHRGPDSSGFWSDEHIALGFRRLKIIDLSSAGEQPMSNEDGSLHVVFNGEIYNFKELREELLKHGHVFKSQSDTEVLLHGYEQWGEEMLPRLRGMFAFALWNTKEQKLLLARDPLGVKPLYFAEREGFIAFASEPKALFALGIKPEIDPVAIDQALTYRYVPPPRSGFKDVEKLPPGNVAVAEKGTLQYRRWWTIEAMDTGIASLEEQRKAWNETRSREGIRPLAHSLIEWLQIETVQRHKTATQQRLLSDVPLGTWISGGIDSALVGWACATSGKHSKSFCAGFPIVEYDERNLASITARRLKIIAAMYNKFGDATGESIAACKNEHSSFEIPADVFRLLPQIVWHTDEPYFDSSCLPTFVLAEKTKPHATVVLSGDGGDEAFAGYDRYVGMKLLERYKNTPALFRRLALAFAKWMHPVPSRQGWDRMLRWLEKCRVMEESGHHPYLAAMELFDPAQKEALYGEVMSEGTDGCDAREYLEGALLRAKTVAPASLPVGGATPASETTGTEAGPTTVLQRADLETYLPGDVLHKVDRMSMAHGVEVRSPFLDVDLVAWALSLPDDVRLPGRQTKPLLRAAAKQVLPPEVVDARKRGFGVPLDEWFRGPLQKIALSLFEGSHLVSDKLFKPRFWEALWREHQDGKAQHGERLYALLALEVWYRTFISGPVPRTRPAELP